MDAKEVLEQIKKHHFWILCAVVLITGLVGWYMAVSDLATKTETQIAAIKGSFNNAQTVVSIPDHPNPNIATEVDKLVQKKKEDVYWGWYAQYQKQQDLVVWPNIDPKFNSEAPKITYPFEKIKKEDPELLSSTARGLYKDYMYEHLPKLAEIIESNWSYTDKLPDSARGTPDAREGKRQLVYWEPDDQLKVVKTHFEPVTRTTPTTLQLAYAQEDYWVLCELLGIIARTNQKTGGGVESTIRTLDSIALGRTAIGDADKFQLAKVEKLPDPVSTISTGTMSRPLGGGGMMGMPGMMGGPPGMQGSMTGSMGGSGGPPMSSPTGTLGQTPMPSSSPTGMLGAGPSTTAGGSTTPVATDDPADSRYVDKDFKPIPAAKARSAISALPSTPEDAALAVAKRLPVRIRVRMDQHRVADLLAECANGKLPVEVRQWRINPQGQQGAKTMGRSRRPTNSMGSGLPMQANEGSERDTTDSDDTEVLFELYGLVYLYNKPNAEQLKLSPVPERKGPPTAAAPIAGDKAT